MTKEFASPSTKNVAHLVVDILEFVFVINHDDTTEAVVVNHKLQNFFPFNDLLFCCDPATQVKGIDNKTNCLSIVDHSIGKRLSWYQSSITTYNSQ